MRTRKEEVARSQQSLDAQVVVSEGYGSVLGAAHFADMVLVLMKAEMGRQGCQELQHQELLDPVNSSSGLADKLEQHQPEVLALALDALIVGKSTVIGPVGQEERQHRHQVAVRKLQEGLDCSAGTTLPASGRKLSLRP